MLTYVVDAIVLFVAALVAWAITRSITVPMGNRGCRAPRRFRRPHLDGAGKRRRRGGRASASFGRDEPRAGADGEPDPHRREAIAVGAEQVARGNQSSRAAPRSMPALFEETASTLEEFTTTVKQNAEHAKQASALAASASTTAQKAARW